MLYSLIYFNCICLWSHHQNQNNEVFNMPPKFPVPLLKHPTAFIPPWTSTDSFLTIIEKNNLDVTQLLYLFICILSLFIVRVCVCVRTQHAPATVCGGQRTAGGSRFFRLGVLETEHSHHTWQQVPPAKPPCKLSWFICHNCFDICSYCDYKQFFIAS